MVRFTVDGWQPLFAFGLPVFALSLDDSLSLRDDPGTTTMKNVITGRHIIRISPSKSVKKNVQNLNGGYGTNIDETRNVFHGFFSLGSQHNLIEVPSGVFNVNNTEPFCDHWTMHRRKFNAVSLAMFYEYLEDIFSWHVTGLKCVWLSIKHICMHVILPYVLIEMSYCLLELDMKVYSWLHRNIGTPSRHRLSTWSKLPGSWSLIYVTFLIQHQVLILAIIRFRYHLHS